MSEGLIGALFSFMKREVLISAFSQTYVTVLRRPLRNPSVTCLHDMILVLAVQFLDLLAARDESCIFLSQVTIPRFD